MAGSYGTLAVLDEITVKVLKYNPETERVSLGLKQTMEDPWNHASESYPSGKKVRGKVVSITDYGAFVELEEGIEGLVHISELSHDHIEDISQHFNKGDEVTAVILNIDPVEQRASLSRKRMLPFTPENAAEFGGNAPAAGAGGGRAGGYPGAGAALAAGVRAPRVPGRRGRRDSPHPCRRPLVDDRRLLRYRRDPRPRHRANATRVRQTASRVRFHHHRRESPAHGR